MRVADVADLVTNDKAGFCLELLHCTNGVDFSKDGIFSGLVAAIGRCHRWCRGLVRMAERSCLQKFFARMLRWWRGDLEVKIRFSAFSRVKSPRFFAFASPPSFSTDRDHQQTRKNKVSYARSLSIPVAGDRAARPMVHMCYCATLARVHSIRHRHFANLRR